MADFHPRGSKFEYRMDEIDLSTMKRPYLLSNESSI